MITSSWQRDVLLDIIRHPKDHIIGWWGRFVLREGTTERTAIWLRHGRRLLDHGETVQAGDEFLEFNCGKDSIWRRAQPDTFGQTIRHGDIPTYRRRIPAPNADIERPPRPRLCLATAPDTMRNMGDHVCGLPAGHAGPHVCTKSYRFYWDGKCWTCGCIATQLDHVRPINRKAGGTNTADNIRPICQECNQKRSHGWHGDAIAEQEASLLKQIKEVIHAEDD